MIASHFIGIMISKTIGFRDTLFSDKPMWEASVNLTVTKFFNTLKGWCVQKSTYLVVWQSILRSSKRRNIRTCQCSIMLRDPFLASGACEFLLLFAAGKASSIQCLQPWHSAAALWPVRDGLHASLSQRRYIYIYHIYINWSHRCKTSHPISIAIPFILTLSIHRNVHYSLLMSPVHGVFCVFWQGGRTSPAIEDGSSDFKAGATSGPCASAVSFCASQEFMPRNILLHIFIFLGGSHEFSWSILDGTPKVFFPNGKWSCKSHFHRISHSTSQKKHLSCSFWGCQKVAGWKNEHLSPWGRRSIKKPDVPLTQGPGRSKRCAESWGKKYGAAAVKSLVNTKITGKWMITLWWTKIAMENGHRNSGFSH